MRNAIAKLVQVVRRYPETTRLVAVALVAFTIGFICRGTPEPTGTAQASSGICRVEDVPNLNEDQRIAVRNVIAWAEDMHYKSLKIVSVSEPKPSKTSPELLGVLVKTIEQNSQDEHPFEATHQRVIKDHRTAMLYGFTESDFAKEYGF